MKAGLVLGVAFLMISVRWAAAAEGAPAAVPPAAVEGSTAGVQPLPGPRSAPPRLTIDPRMIEGALFYDVVGRPDLAAEYRTRHGWAVASRVVGGISLGLGAFTWLSAQLIDVAFKAPFCGLQTDPACRQGPGTLWVPDLMMAGGLALLILPGFWSNDPVSLDEKADLARKAEARAEATRRFPWHVTAAPTPSGQGGALAFSGRF